LENHEYIGRLISLFGELNGLKEKMEFLDEIKKVLMEFGV
jgi:hypothetical protein